MWCVRVRILNIGTMTVKGKNWLQIMNVHTLVLILNKLGIVSVIKRK